MENDIFWRGIARLLHGRVGEVKWTMEEIYQYFKERMEISPEPGAVLRAWDEGRKCGFEEGKQESETKCKHILILEGGIGEATYYNNYKRLGHKYCRDCGEKL